MDTKKCTYAIVALTITGILTSFVPALAASNSNTDKRVGGQGRLSGQMDQVPGQRQGQGIFGTVLTINGNNITVTAKSAPNSTTSATYIVDATNATVTKDNATSTVSSIVVGDTVSVRGTISGTSITATAIRDGQMGQGRGPQNSQTPGIFGTVATISGNTITVTAKSISNSTAATTYTVDASNATVTKNNATSTVSNIAIGDAVLVKGTISGSNVTATAIRDGQMAPKNAAAAIEGDGQPVIAGTISSISGEIVTITNKSNSQYLIDATNAKITRGQDTIQISDMKVGDSLVAQGTVNGTSVVATSIIDQLKPAYIAVKTPNNAANKAHLGFFGSISQFIKHLFGF